MIPIPIEIRLINENISVLERFLSKRNQKSWWTAASNSNSNAHSNAFNQNRKCIFNEIDTFQRISYFRNFTNADWNLTKRHSSWSLLIFLKCNLKLETPHVKWNGLKPMRKYSENEQKFIWKGFCVFCYFTRNFQFGNASFSCDNKWNFSFFAMHAATACNYSNSQLFTFEEWKIFSNFFWSKSNIKLLCWFVWVQMALKMLNFETDDTWHSTSDRQKIEFGRWQTNRVTEKFGCFAALNRKSIRTCNSRHLCIFEKNLSSKWSEKKYSFHSHFLLAFDQFGSIFRKCGKSFLP